ncbi:hypothetical protein MA16_Dca024968 [Dendrobium catenatum]|uniref:MIP18 family-like domain-containing protein n=1 Tax=Dendrobium catenatum TaxID=906689 RepID=A0A2I0W2V9_9ASPA|nr:hypothetical protein MA16_Dca024968 [Dendrobium catenatum]
MISVESAKKDVLTALSQIIDPDFGADIVSCGFVKDLHIDDVLKEVSFRLELTTPACPIKDEVNEKFFLEFDHRHCFSVVILHLQSIYRSRGMLAVLVC